MSGKSPGSTGDGQYANGIRFGSETSRRRFLQASAGAAALAAGFSAAGTSVAAQEEYETVYDVVEDLGADNTGDEPINDALAEAIAEIEYDIDGMGDIEDIEYEEGDSVKIVFPDGEYLIENGPGGDGFARWPFAEDEEQKFLGKLALVGEGDVTLRVPDGGRHNILTFWGRELIVEGFRIDQTAHDTSTGITAIARDHLHVRDILFDGMVTGDYEETPHWQDPEYSNDLIPNDPKCIIPGLLSEDGEGVIEHLYAPDGVESLSRKGGCWVNFVHTGDLLFRECEFSNFSDNAIYASPPGLGHGGGGSVRVENCLFVNNNITAVRLGSPGSYARNCTVITEAGEIPATPWGAITSRAGWVWYHFDGYYEDIDVIHEHPAGEGILDHGDTTRDLHLEVRNCRLELNGNERHAVRFVHDGVESLSIEDVSVTGDAAGGTVFDVANCELAVDNVCVEQSGNGRDGFTLEDVTGSIANSVLDVTGEQFVLRGDTDVQATNIHDAGDGSCPTPDPDHDFDSTEPGPSPTPPDDSGWDDHLASGDVEKVTPTPEPTPEPTETPTEEPTEAEQTEGPTPADEEESAAMPGFTGIVTLGALAATAAALLRRSGSDDEDV